MISGDDVYGSGLVYRRRQHRRQQRQRQQCQRQRRFIEVTHLIVAVLIATTRTCRLANGVIAHKHNYSRRFSPFDRRKKCQQSSSPQYNDFYRIRGGEIIGDDEEEKEEYNNDIVMSVLGENYNERRFEKQKCRSWHNRWRYRSLPSPRFHEYNQVLVLRGGENREDAASSGVYNRFNSIRRGNNSSNSKRNVQHHKNHSPVVYQYFGKSRSRGHQYPSSRATDDAQLNFILLGPNVDHWKAVGQILASRGFNVMVCERMIPDENDGEDSNNEAATKFDDAPELVLEILGTNFCSCFLEDFFKFCVCDRYSSAEIRSVKITVNSHTKCLLSSYTSFATIFTSQISRVSTDFFFLCKNDAWLLCYCATIDK
ncbi:MAG: hypothetical protein ACI8RD_008895 [Bacillariaceae sp.]|jgi:hypothetical protein